MRSVKWLTVMCAALCGLWGCRAPQPAPGVNPNTPPDFAVEMFYDGDSDAQTPDVQRLKVVLESDRWLRVARGRGVKMETFPLRVARLSGEQIDQLVAIMRSAHLLAEPTSPTADRLELYHGEQRVVYHVTLTAWNRTHHYATTGPESPPTVELLHAMLRMGQVAHLAPELAP